MPDTDANPVASADAAKKERFNRVLEVFSRVVGLNLAERKLMLSELCGDDADLRHQVVLMLAADDGMTQARLRTGSGSGIGAIDGTFTTEDQLKDLPRISGQYRLIRQLGEGGMGVVYLAEQTLPRRFVALKAIRAGLSSRQILERFKRETHILGRLQDPGIAQIFEAGILDDDDSGRAYIVMEFVDGLTLTKFADQKQLSRDSRIELMIKVCAAVHHAHLKRVIHRDLKPANVLVNSEGNPKILDFGIASLESDTEQQLTITREGQILGTPAYMAPEQVRGHEIDSRADVYALGAMLFELLTSKLPHDLTGLNLPSALEKVRTQSPRRALSIEATLDPNLDAIVAMALSNDPSQRYQSADALAEDLRKHQNGEPIAARRETGAAMLLRLLKRHRLITAAAAVSVVVLIASTLIFGDLSRRNALLAKDAEIATGKIAAQAGELKRALYISKIGNAEAALAAGDTVKAKARLLECDEENRGWEWRHLYRAVDQSISEIALPAGSSIVAFDAASTHAYVHRIGLPWVSVNLASGAKGPELGTAGEVVEAVVSPDGEWLVSRTRMGGVELVSLKSSVPTRKIDFGSNDARKLPSISRVAWLNDGDEFVCLSSNGKGFVFHVEREGLVRQLESRPITAYDAKKRPQHDQWMATFEDLTVQLRSSLDGTVILEKTGLPAIPVSIGFSPDGQRAAIGCFDGTVAFWDLQSNELRQVRGHKSSIRAMAFSPDGLRVASGGRDRVVKVWDFTSGGQVSSQAGEEVRITSMQWKDANHIITAGEGGPIRVFRADAPPVIPVFDCKGDTTIGSDTWKQWSTVAMRSGEIVFFNHNDWSRGTSIECPSLLHTKFTPSGMLIASTSTGALRFYDATSEKRLLATDTTIQGEAAYLVGSSDRSHIAALQADKGVAIIDVAAMKVGKFISLPAIQGLELLNDGNLLVSRTHPDRLELIESESGKTLWRVDAAAFIGAYAASESQKLVAIAVSRKTLDIHDMETGRKLRTIAASNLDLGILQFFDHDTRLAGGGQDPVVRVWSLSDGVEVATLTGHRSYISGLMVCDDSQSLITIDVSGMLRKWRSDAFAAPGKLSEIGLRRD